MSIKRLKHHAYNLGQMFCGWELMFDYRRFADLKRGTLRIDMLSERCYHNGRIIDSLRIVDRLREWMLRDLDHHNLAVEQLECAEIIVDFSTRRQQGQRTRRSTWKEVTPHFIHCTFECTGRVSTGTREFVANYSDEEEWPESYSWIK